WRSDFVLKLQQACPDIVLTTKDAPCVDNTVSLLLPAVSAQIAVMSLDMDGFAISSGAACSSGKVQESHVIKAMGFGSLSSHVIRISFGWENSQDDISALADALIAIYKRHQEN
ncbi:MAG: aminotransferase class V-fold PLP-dependent enzyme, partial [Alphaproteobacteria bacterium]|nr:aminotransferase class V-fold PLP-dependent enzyme [Alphaproteobacteria bacterium]